jgi:ABC-type cobalt transport system, permease component CbiQ and related transporters
VAVTALLLAIGVILHTISPNIGGVTPNWTIAMLTTALRFVPDFLTDSATTLDAQSCRGYSNRGNIFKRLYAYLAVVKPLVMRAVAKSDTLALSMELKGFGANTYQNMCPQKLGVADYMVLLIVIVLSAYPLWSKYL